MFASHKGEKGWVRFWECLDIEDRGGQKKEEKGLLVYETGHMPLC